MADEATFNIDTIAGIANISNMDNLNDLHLSQLNSQLRYELRNLNKDAGVQVQLSDEEEEDNAEADENDEETSEFDDQEGENDVEENNRNEPFKNYIKSIVERGDGLAFDNQYQQHSTQLPAQSSHSLLQSQQQHFHRHHQHPHNNHDPQYQDHQHHQQLSLNLQQRQRKRQRNEKSDIDKDIKKCSRCRMKRVHENENELEKYQTCIQCRERRKVKEKKPRGPMKLPELRDDWKGFLDKVAMNSIMDVQGHIYRAYTDERQFPRYSHDDLTTDIVQKIGDKIVEKYIHPLQELTGFKFAIRDHHNPPLYDKNRSKKITWMFICSQDKFRRRKSRSENKRQVLNKLKTEECCSKISLSYDIINGIVQISYNHKHHKPYNLIDSSGAIKPSRIHLENEQAEVDRAVMEAAAAAVAAVAASDEKKEAKGEEHEENKIVIARSHARNDNNNNDNNNNSGTGTNGNNENISSGDERSKNNYDPNRVFGESTSFDDISLIGNVHVNNVDVDNVGVDVDVDVDVDDINVEDVAEIAKLLKQVQQAQSRRLDDEVPEEEQDHDHNKEDNNDQDNIEPVVEGENSTAAFDISPVLLAHVQRQLHNFQDLPKDQHHVNSSPDS